jgi:bacillopeptidase F
VVTPPAPTAAATTATLATARALLGRSTASFSADVHGLSTATVRLVSALGAVSPETLTCTNAGGAAVPCTSGGVRAVSVVPTKALTPGQQYTFSVQGTDALGRTVAGSQAFRASTDEQESSPAAVYGWAKVSSTKALGHSYFVENAKGATATVVFTGRTVTWLTTTGPTQGLAKVYVDGVRKAKVNNWSAATHWQVARTIKGLKAGTHRLKIVVTGRKGNAKGTGTDVVMDGVKVGKKLGRNAPVFSWRHVSATTASAGGYAVSVKKGATASFTFRGTSLSWVSAKGPTMGKAKVYVDGVLKGTVDNYAKRSGFGLKRTFTGLADKVHTVKVVATGTKRKTSKGTSVVVDRWLVG